MLNLSIITACIPCLKRVLGDLRTGIMSVAIPEPFEMSVTGKLSSRGVDAVSRSGPSMGSKIAARLGLTSSQQRSANKSTLNSSGGGSRDLEKSYKRRSEPGAVERSESVKHLKEGVIVRQSDFTVEYDARGPAPGHGRPGAFRHDTESQSSLDGAGVTSAY